MSEKVTGARVCVCGNSVTAESNDVGAVMDILRMFDSIHERHGDAKPDGTTPPPPPSGSTEDRGSVSATAVSAQAMPWQFGFRKPRSW